MVIWCLGWNLFVLFFLFFFLPEALAGKVNWEGGGPVSPISACLFLTPFVLVGLGSLYVLLRCGTRRAVLTVDAEGLSLDQRTLFSRRKERWSRGELVGIEVSQTAQGPSGMSQAGKAALCLVTRGGEKQRRLGLRPLSEIKWLVDLLKKILELNSL